MAEAEDQVGGGIAALMARAEKADATGARIGSRNAETPAQNSVPDPDEAPEAPAPAAKKAAKKSVKKASKSGSDKAADNATTQQRNKKASNATTQQPDYEERTEEDYFHNDDENEDDDRDDDYVSSAAKGVIDPERPTAQLNNRLPPYLKKLLKFVAFEEGTTEQQLVIDVLKGERPALGDSHPKLYRRFYQWAQEGKLK